jgi:rubredoxin
MKLVQATKEKQVYVINQKDWLSIGKKAGWLKRSEWDGYCPEEPEVLCGECNDVMLWDDKKKVWHCPDCKTIDKDEDDNFPEPSDDIGFEGRNREFGGIDLPDSRY